MAGAGRHDNSWNTVADSADRRVAGRRRTATFLVYPNYEAVLAYNCVHAYGLSVGLLADSAK